MSVLIETSHESHLLFVWIHKVLANLQHLFWKGEPNTGSCNATTNYNFPHNL